LDAVRAAVTVRVWNPQHLGGKRTVAQFVRRHLAGERQREQRPAVEAVLEAQHAGPLRGVPRNLHGVLDRFGAAVDEQRLLRERSGREPGETLGKGDVRLVGQDREADVREALGLFSEGGDDRRRGMPDVHHADAAGEIELDVLVDVGHAHAVGRRGEDRHRMRQPARHGGVSSPHQRARPRSRDLGATTNHAHACVPSVAVTVTARGEVLLLETCMVVNFIRESATRSRAWGSTRSGTMTRAMKRTRSRAPGARVGLLTVSETAGILGVSPSTLRLWESVGLITPARSNGRYRLYSPELLEVLKRIKYLRDVKQLNLPGIRQMLGKTATVKQTNGSRPTDLGPKLRRLRKRAGLGVVDAAKKAKISAGFLSAIELSRANPSVATLQRLSATYGTTVL